MKRKILQFSIAASKGGRTQYILNNWNNIDKERFQFDFLTFDSYLDFESELEAQGCRVYHLPCYPQQNLNLFCKTLRNIFENDYDTLHLHTRDWSGFEVEEIAKECDIPQIIIHAHSSGYQRATNKEEELQGQARHYEMRKQLNENMATDFVACSETAIKWMFGEQISRNRIKIMRNAIDTDKFSFSEEKRKKVRKELCIEGKYILGHVGRMEPVKNHKFLISIFNEISKLIPEAVLLLVGDGRVREQVEEQIRDLNLQKKVMLLGKRDDANMMMQAMDILLLPSLFEGFPMVLVEAQTSGLPCIVSDKVTKEAAITPLVSYRSLVIDEWIKKIQDIYQDRNRTRKSMHSEVAAAGYEIRNQIKELEELYERV